MAELREVQSKFSRVLILMGLVLAGIVLLWLTYTPPGLLGKVDALGYSVCHQDAAHTLGFGGMLLPLCSRCTGMYLGTCIAFLFLIPQGRARRFPSRGKLILLGIFSAVFVLDSANSAVAILGPQLELYVPSNEIRLFTGLGFGMGIASVLLPIWNQTLWAESSDCPVIRSWGQFLGLLLVETLTGLLVLTKWQGLFWPIAILSTGMIPVLFTMIYSLIMVISSKRENQLHSWKEGLIFFVFGALCAVTQISLLDALRFWVTGTWQGFVL